jgi:hypothetical protein
MQRVAKYLLALLFIFGSGSAFAVSVPTIHQVYAAAHSGHLREAQEMMGQVLAVHPNSGKAHFVLAEILAGEHHYAGAGHELSSAQQLAPGLPFEKPRAVQALQTRIQQGLAGGHNMGNPMARHTSSSMPWVMILLSVAGVILLAVVVRALRTPRAMPASYPRSVPSGNMTGNMGPGPYTPMAPYGGGFMSSLKTGLGIGAGMAAGEALVDHFIDGRGNPGVGPMMPDQAAPPMADDALGGNDFGMNDDSAWSDDSMGGDDFSDFGGGGDDWN